MPVSRARIKKNKLPQLSDQLEVLKQGRKAKQY
jgi:hypothetical protein